MGKLHNTRNKVHRKDSEHLWRKSLSLLKDRKQDQINGMVEHVPRWAQSFLNTHINLIKIESQCTFFFNWTKLF